MHVADAALLLLPAQVQFGELLVFRGELFADFLQSRDGARLRFVDELALGDLELNDTPLNDVDFRRHALELHGKPAHRFVDQVDRFVRQESV